MKVRFEFNITDMHGISRVRIFNSEPVELTNEEFVILVTPSIYGTMKSNQWITVDDEKGWIIIKNLHLPISYLKYAKIVRVD
jgi:hypothetical protein